MRCCGCVAHSLEGMDRLDTTLTTAPLPSLSPLSGVVRPATAAAALEESWNTLRRKPDRTWKFSMPRGYHGNQDEQVGSLSGAARQHVTSMGRTSPAPYQRALTPQEREDAEQRARKQVEVLAKVLQQAQLSSAQDTTHSTTDTAGQPDMQSRPVTSASVSKPLTPQQVIKDIKQMLHAHSRPPSTLSLKELTMQRPMSHQIRLKGLSGPTLHPATSPQGGTPHSSLPTTPVLRTPKRLGSRGGLLRASAPAPLGRAPTPPEVWVNPQAKSSLAAEEKERLLLRSSMGNAAAADATGTTGSATAAAAARARLLASRACTPGALPCDSQALHPGPSRPHTAAAATCTKADTVKALTGRPLGAPGNPRWGPGQPLAQFVPTRGLVYCVFSELDPGDTGKLTLSEFEEACVLCGLRPEQTRKLFHLLDPEDRGYFTIRDWGSPEHEKEVMDFTKLYIHTTRGPSGKPLNVREMKSVALAVQVALNKLQIKNNGRVVSQDKLMHAFEFMDSDGSGALSLAEVQDGFNAMGIYVTPDVLNEIMEKFDANGNGVIEYREFLGALYPILSKGM